MDAVRSTQGVPTLLCVDLAVTPAGEKRMSMPTHDMVRHGREESFATASPTGQGAVDFVLGMSEWMLRDPDKQLPSADTVGASGGASAPRRPTRRKN